MSIYNPKETRQYEREKTQPERAKSIARNYHDHPTKLVNGLKICYILTQVLNSQNLEYKRIQYFEGKCTFPKSATEALKGRFL